MKHVLWGVLLVSMVLSCKDSEAESVQVTISDGTKTYKVYQDSEMSTLMKGMYAYNQQIKKQIEAGEALGDFPDMFLNIHSAQLSETKSRTENFDYYTDRIIDAERLIFVEDTLASPKERYNNAINLCLACHKTECTGPIPKIKKLLIP